MQNKSHEIRIYELIAADVRLPEKVRDKARLKIENLETEELHKRMTKNGSFYDLNHGRFKGMDEMSYDDELNYVAKILKQKEMRK